MYILIQAEASRKEPVICAVPAARPYLEKLLSYANLITALNDLDDDLSALQACDWSANWYCVDQEEYALGGAPYKVVGELPASAVTLESDPPATVLTPRWVYWLTITEDGQTVLSKPLERRMLEDLLRKHG